MKWIKDVAYNDRIDKESYQDLLKQLQLKTPVIIKPNWGTSICYTEAQIIDWTLDTLHGDAIIVESYGWSRTQDMLENGKLGSKKRGDLRKSDKWFLEYSGIGKVLERNGVEFLNITEENWAHRAVDSGVIKKHVEEKHAPVNDQDFYSWVPERLYDMRGGDFLSLSKLRLGITDIPAYLSIKNLFGMIPHTNRWKYHGKNNNKLDQNIIDIYKIYDALFTVKGVAEAVFTHTDMDIEHNKMRVLEEMGFAAASKKPLHLDAVVIALMGIQPYKAHIKLFAEEIGGWDESQIEKAKHTRMRSLHN